MIQQFPKHKRRVRLVDQNVSGTCLNPVDLNIRDVCSLARPVINTGNRNISQGEEMNLQISVQGTSASNKSQQFLRVHSCPECL